jgi:hypothetical protein
VLGNARRCVRGAVGAAALLAILLIPSLSATWLFVLAMIGAYQSLTAILNADLIYGVFNPGATVSASSREEVEDTITTARLGTADEQYAY